MTNIEKIEQVTLDFIIALDNAGMQDSTGEENKPKYYRSYVPSTELQNSNPLFLVYGYQDEINISADDNAKYLSTIYIRGRLMNSSNDGQESVRFQQLKKKVEEELIKNDFIINWGADSIDTSLATDAPIYYNSFECYKVIL